MRDQQQQMEFSTRKKGPKPELRGTRSVPVSPSSWRQARNRPVIDSPPAVPQPYLTPISTKKSGIDTEQVCVSSQVPVRHIPPPKFVQQLCVSSQVPVRHIPPPKFLPPQHKPIETDGGRKVARSHSVLNVRRRRDLAYLVVDLQPRPGAGSKCVYTYASTVLHGFREYHDLLRLVRCVYASLRQSANRNKLYHGCSPTYYISGLILE